MIFRDPAMTAHMHSLCSRYRIPPASKHYLQQRKLKAQAGVAIPTAQGFNLQSDGKLNGLDQSPTEKKVAFMRGESMFFFYLFNS